MDFSAVLRRVKTFKTNLNIIIDCIQNKYAFIMFILEDIPATCKIQHYSLQNDKHISIKCSCTNDENHVLTIHGKYEQNKHCIT